MSAKSTQLVLASASPRRSDLLREAGISFLAQPSNVEEKPQPGLSPQALAMRHAQSKAQAVAAKFPLLPTLGADTVVAIDGESLGKPADLAEAADMLRRLSGRTHTVFTAVCIIRMADGRMDKFCEATAVAFKPLGDEAIKEYLELIQPLDKAGGYAAQEYRELIIERIDGLLSNVIGLPIERVVERLAAFGTCFADGLGKDYDLA